ncbi:hypothetical protein EDC65_3944 [Stella humosa]|uniref:DNA breaking-rejoining protein n=2 Tax=Stella humosa TaxID=94 RepID=A0A3N1L0U0_9PROT|nr:hypothetical protein EDC65_3944 [Stella humosa]
MNPAGILACVLVAGMVLAPPLAAQTRARMQFAAGNDNAHVEATIRGKAYRDHVLGARAGQRMQVSLSTKGNAYFNILPPGSGGEAIYIGSLSGRDGGVDLPATGDYVVRVYLMGADASSNKTVRYTLSVGIR